MTVPPSAATPPVIDGATVAERLGISAHSDGAFTPVQTRSERFASVDVEAFDPVTGREIAWKLTPVNRLRDLIDGELSGRPVPFQYTPVEGVDVSWVGREDERIGTAGLPEDRAAANAWSSFEKALAVHVSGEAEKVAMLVRSTLSSDPRAAHTIIEAEPYSRAVVVVQNEGEATLTENVEILVGEGAQLTVVTVQEWADDARHLANHLIRVGRDATLKHIVVTLGGAIVRVNPSAHLVERGADGQLFGLYFADAGQHLEQQVYVDHDAPDTRSRVNYKGALQGEGARSVWIGDVLIRRSATGTDSYEQNRNLVLSDGTRADSVPNLEIETGDIVGAGHASATGRFDDEQLFYLQSRGIREEEARRLVVRGFLSEIVQQINVAELEDRLQLAIEAELVGSAGQTGSGEAEASA
ncbi:Fe-S cluster assembly protein SufD [Rathayibacter toxicus]|uniref:Fe-S cluster assembly protein SufD n=1 Tax=Rathayibacter toxicus TaxID=145458 RepID=UPI000CE922FE|nr:Fe-S cluster assembly protein SufD [Rathayibacter toxicus]PPI55366.1 Fe-S cluster assembly protein SufD [Rathayibacter toxicus]QOD11300.1 Fe-S cluster assembly protein SufD [Rathayibacter toxicus]QWL28044.1 Fe-S cluster assembly protein SufD [Rathayibacter toxicus]